MSMLPEPAYTHGAVARPGLLLVNLGTPDEPTAPAVRRYLAEFLADPRVVEIPRAVWRPILHGIVLRVRPARSAARYKAIWTADGSPLLFHTRRQALLLTGSLGERLKRAGLPADHVAIEVAMRYGKPSIGAAIGRLRAAGCDRLLVAPLYPQYSASTTASACDAVFASLSRLRYMPAVRTIASFHDDPGYVRALATSVNAFWEKSGRPDRLVMSFHGVPRFTLDRGDPYHCFCRKTGRLLAEALGLRDGDWVLTFQSRFGKAEWLKPYTAPTLIELAKAGVNRVDLVCPGFTSDCLETLEEIAIEGKADFLRAGGREYRYIPCLNEDPDWIRALSELCWQNLQGWLSAPPAEAERRAQAERARALGAAG
jgi:ferrochelatase